MNDETEELYPCVGVCMADPESGYCLGCGRPPLPSPDTRSAPPAAATAATASPPPGGAADTAA